MHNKIVTILHLTLIFFVIFTLAPLPKAIAVETTCHGLTITWDIELTDLVLGYESSSDYACNYYYASEQLVPNSTLHMAVAIGSSYFGENPINGGIHIGPGPVSTYPGGHVGCSASGCKNGLSAIADVAIPATAGYQSVQTTVYAQDGDKGEQKGIGLYISIWKSKEIKSNPEKKGGPADNMSTDFDGFS